MQNRRNFLKSSLLLAGGAAVTAGARGAMAGDQANGYPVNIVFTAANPGVWAGKEGSHAPQITVAGGKATVFTKHGMSEEHFIVRHTLVTGDGKVLGAKLFSPSDEEAKSEYALPEGYKGKLYATSFCNKHDFWLSETEV